MLYSQKNFMRIIGNDQKNNEQNFSENLERMIGKILSIIDTGLVLKVAVAAVTTAIVKAYCLK